FPITESECPERVRFSSLARRLRFPNYYEQAHLQRRDNSHPGRFAAQSHDKPVDHHEGAVHRWSSVYDLFRNDRNELAVRPTGRRISKSTLEPSTCSISGKVPLLTS